MIRHWTGGQTERKKWEKIKKIKKEIFSDIRCEKSGGGGGVDLTMTAVVLMFWWGGRAEDGNFPKGKN